MKRGTIYGGPKYFMGDIWVFFGKWIYMSYIYGER